MLYWLTAKCNFQQESLGRYEAMFYCFTEVEECGSQDMKHLLLTSLLLDNMIIPDALLFRRVTSHLIHLFLIEVQNH